MTTETDIVAILVDDMFFTSKINGAAAESGRRIERVKSLEQLEALAITLPVLVIIDLNSDRVDPLQAIGFLKSIAELSKVPIVSFCSHVQTDLIRAAHAAGSDYVLPRSSFAQKLPHIVAGNFALI